MVYQFKCVFLDLVSQCK